jgi:hypothetical protein
MTEDRKDAIDREACCQLLETITMEVVESY